MFLLTLARRSARVHVRLRTRGRPPCGRARQSRPQRRVAACLPACLLLAGPPLPRVGGWGCARAFGAAIVRLVRYINTALAFLLTATFSEQCRLPFLFARPRRSEDATECFETLISQPCPPLSRFPDRHVAGSPRVCALSIRTSAMENPAPREPGENRIVLGGSYRGA